MRLSVAFILAAGLADSVNAFTPSSLLSQSPSSRTRHVVESTREQQESHAQKVSESIQQEVHMDKAKEELMDLIESTSQKTPDKDAPTVEAPGAEGSAHQETSDMDAPAIDFPGLYATAPAAPTANVQPPVVLPGVKLPEGEVPDPHKLPKVEESVNKFLGATVAVGLPNSAAENMVGNKKTEDFVVAQKNIIATQNLAAGIPYARKYKFFGTKNHSKNLMYLLKTNPFFATALSEGTDGLGIRSFSPEDPNNESPDAGFYRKMMGTYTTTGHRVNIIFNDDLTEVKTVQVYDDVTGDLVTKIEGSRWCSHENKELIEKWSSSVIFNLLAYSSCVHATIHVLHFVLTAALDYCSDGFDEMKGWTRFYANHVPTKYGQVADLLIREMPGVTPTFGLPGIPIVDAFKDTFALVTGPQGFGFDGRLLRPILNELIDAWCKNPSDFMETTSNISARRMKRAGVLEAFNDQHDLVNPYAREVSEALRDISRDKHTIAELRTKLYLKRCGINSNIDTIEQWIKLMGVSGIMHGSTLSYSRLFAIGDVMRWRNVQSDTWEAADVAISTKGLGTICGMQEHRHVFFSEEDEEGIPYGKELQHVLNKYDKKSDKLKEAYKKKIMKHSKTFYDYGWILSDFCPDGFDGKQLTVATYI